MWLATPGWHYTCLCSLNRVKSTAVSFRQDMRIKRVWKLCVNSFINCNFIHFVIRIILRHLTCILMEWSKSFDSQINNLSTTYIFTGFAIMEFWRQSPLMTQIEKHYHEQNGRGRKSWMSECINVYISTNSVRIRSLVFTMSTNISRSNEPTSSDCLS